MVFVAVVSIRVRPELVEKGTLLPLSLVFIHVPVCACAFSRDTTLEMLSFLITKKHLVTLYSSNFPERCGVQRFFRKKKIFQVKKKR